MSVGTITESGQYLTFTLDTEIYAINIVQVREVLDMTKVTKLPGMPKFMRGVINLRGGVVPVIDLRRKFDIPAAEDTVDTCIMIMEIRLHKGKTVIGAIADSVREVITLETKEIEPPPKLGTRLHTDFIRGMSKLNDQFIIILNVEKVFTTDELLSALDHKESAHHSETTDKNSEMEEADENIPVNEDW